MRITLAALLALMLFHVPAANALQLGELKCDSRSGEPFFGSIAIRPDPGEEFQYGRYRVASFVQKNASGNEVRSGDQKIVLKLYGGTAPHIEISGPVIVGTEILLTVEADLGPVTTAQSYSYAVGSRSQIVAVAPVQPVQPVAVAPAPAPVVMERAEEKPVVTRDRNYPDAEVVRPRAGGTQVGFSLGGTFGRADGLDEIDGFHFDLRALEIGFLLDTGMDSVFNYRLHAAVSVGTADNFRIDGFGPVPGDFTDDLVGAMATNTFRFRVVHGRDVTFSLGPSLYLGYLKFTDQDTDASDGDGVYFGLGPTAMLDIQLTPRMSLALEASYRYGRVSLQDDSFPTDVDFEINEGLIRAGLLFGR